MPVNLDALLRYHTINHCLQQRGKKWTWVELANACANYADEVAYRDSRNIPSKRTIQNDIKLMRSDDLGYFAPIKNENGKYFYVDTKYSIKNTTLNRSDFENISLAAKVLGRYKGFDFFNDLNPIFSKFESHLQVKLNNDFNEYIQFETTQELKGSSYLKEILNAIENKIVLRIHYQKFGDNESKPHTLHPYLLKEYQNRWYVLGDHHDKARFITFALDRIEQIDLINEMDYRENSTFNHDEYFKNTIGITYTGAPAEKITIKVEADFAPYFLTKPLHHSQMLIAEADDYLVFEYYLVINQELENILMSHINHLFIIGPLVLKESLFNKIQKATKNFS